MRWLAREGPVILRVAVAVPIGIAVALAVGVTAGWAFAPPAGWIAGAATYLAWTWIAIGRMDAAATKSHATREDPTRSYSDTLVVSASVASLVGVGYLLAAGRAHGAEAEIAAAVGFASVVAAWFAVHTVYSLRYARFYYTGETGGIEFNQQEPPAYVDFAYLGFTIGMTYQVSDTALKATAVRSTALRQAILSYLLGAVVLAITINLIAGLANSG
ncbi:MAG TPA: DUF1345 domain-containing protein [Mycobacterium sp.]|nr:DUF1345 domain-containing protein [Mycobacterium sp.]